MQIFPNFQLLEVAIHNQMFKQNNVLVFSILVIPQCIFNLVSKVLSLTPEPPLQHPSSQLTIYLAQPVKSAAHAKHRLLRWTLHYYATDQCLYKVA